MKEEKGSIKKMSELRFQLAMDEFTASLAKMRHIVGEANFNFTGIFTIYDNIIRDLERDSDIKSNSVIWAIGDLETNIAASEELIDDLIERLPDDEEPVEQEKGVIPITGFGNNPKAEA